MKLLDKNKTKKLDWDKELEETIMEELLEQFHCKGGKTLNGEDVYLMTKSDIDNLLTQQRAELLEEILEQNKDDMTGLYDYDGIAETVISLLNKKDE